jgi:hypothetical protein
VFLLVGLFWKSARYYSYEDMFVEAILVMICYNCLLAISLLLLYVSIVLSYSKLLNTHISTNVFLLFGARRVEYATIW